MSTFNSPPPPLSQLLWAHYRWHLGVGLVIGGSLLAALAGYDYVREERLFQGFGFYAFMLWTGFLFAAISGLMRHNVLASLSKGARTRRELIWKSLLAFELIVLLLSLVPWPVAYNQFSLSMVRWQFLAGFLISLPWLIATGLASRKLAVVLGLPQNSN